MWLFRLIGCAGPEDADSPAVVVPAPLAWTYTSTDRPAGVLTVDVLSEALTGAIGLAARTDPLVFINAYWSRLGGASVDCPTFISAGPTDHYWRGDCVADSGVAFDGWVTSWFSHNVVNPEDGQFCDALAFYYGFATITSADGDPFLSYGTARYDSCEASDGGRSIEAELKGDFYWPLADDLFLGTYVPTALVWRASIGSTRAVSLTGTFSGMEGPISAIRFDGLVFDDAGVCTLEPSGAVWMWDEAGADYEIVFGGACDGCGAASTSAGPIGDVCADFSGWYAWNDRPWF